MKELLNRILKEIISNLLCKKNARIAIFLPGETSLSFIQINISLQLLYNITFWNRLSSGHTI
jgi:hypothetical protein